MANDFLDRPTGKIRGQTEILKGSPVFPIVTFRMEICLPFTNFLSFVPV